MFLVTSESSSELQLEAILKLKLGLIIEFLLAKTHEIEDKNKGCLILGVI